MAQQTVIVVDFGGQYNQLIARRVRENKVYCEVVPYNRALAAIREKQPVGVIFTGGPASVFEAGAPAIDPEVFRLGIPVLGICYGAQLMAQALGGRVEPAGQREYGKTVVDFETAGGGLFAGMPGQGVVWMSHGVMITQVPEGFSVAASTPSCPVAVMQDPARKMYGLQFHPEVTHTDNGGEVIRRFLYDVCGCTGDWSMEDYGKRSIEETRAKVGDGKVLLALSGGVDSSVVATLLAKAVGPRLSCIFVDTGLMRKNEGDEIESVFGGGDMHFVRVDAADRFLGRLAGVEDPEQKRKIIGEEFIRVFEEEAQKIGKVDFLAQGTIYPDVIESGEGDANVIKSHHNVGGLPDHVDFKDIIEPLRPLFKDEVRALGRELGLPASLVNRQPFPGPGLAVRVIGEITKPKLDLLREADAVFREEVAGAGLEGEVDQYFAVLTGMRSVGVMGDGRTYDYTLALRAVTTSDFMTADWARLPYEVLEKTANRIVNEVKHINRIVYDITSKPPGTIEWE